jgi:hypothetical protein
MEHRMNRRKLLALSASSAWLGSVSTTVQAAPAPLAATTGVLSVREFGVVGDGLTDDTSALQRAIDYVRGEAARLHDTSHLPCLSLPAGRYLLSETIQIAPWVKLCTVGSVLLDFTHLPVDQDGVVCRNEITDLPRDLSYPGNRSPFLDGSGGTLSILGPGSSRSNGWGIVMGNRDSRFPGTVRDAGGRNVVVTGWRGALRIDPIHIYLNSWISCRFEQNREDSVYVAALPTRNGDSGERMTFYDCTFSRSKRILNVDSDSQDFVFDACSFDFTGDVIRFGPNSRYGTVALSHCHIEGIDGLLIDASEAGERLRVVIRDSIVLPRRWKQKGSPNEPRRLVSGKIGFSASGIEFRFEAPFTDANHALIGDEVRVEALTALSFPGFLGLPWRGSILNADGYFQCDAVGTPLADLTYWKSEPDVNVISSGTLRMRSGSTDGAGRELVLASPSSTDANIVLNSRAHFLVRPGETICAACCASSSQTQGSIVVLVDFLDIDGKVLHQASSSVSSNAFVPTLRATAPAGAFYGRLHAVFCGWVGDLLITSLVAWRTA